MSKSACRCVSILIGAGFAAIPPLRAELLIRLGSEFQVNTYTPSAQSSPGVALDDDGDFVVTWMSSQDGSLNGVVAQRFKASGSPEAIEFQVNTSTVLNQVVPAVAMDSGGRFVIAWSSSGQEGSNFGVFARRFDATGAPQATEFHVNTFTPLNQANVDVALDGDGDFVVIWTSADQDGSGDGVFARRFDADGAPQSTELQINTFTLANQAGPAVALDGDGDFVVTWGSNGQDGSFYGVFARRFNAAGVPQAGEFQVNTYTARDQYRPDVAVDDGGDFVITWSSYGQDGAYNGVFARRFDSAGAPQAAEFQVNSRTETSEYRSVLALDGVSFVITWSSDDQYGSDFGLFARRFDTSGAAQATEFQVNTYTPNHQRIPVMAMDGDGDFVVAWQSLDQDGSSYGIFAQRFATFAILDIDGNGETAPLTDGLLVLRFLFGFNGATLVAGAVDLTGCSRCNAPAIEGYLQTLI